MKFKCKGCGHIHEIKLRENADKTCKVIPAQVRCNYCLTYTPPLCKAVPDTIENWKQAYLELVERQQKQKKNYYVPRMEELKKENKLLQARNDKLHHQYIVMRNTLGFIQDESFSEYEDAQSVAARAIHSVNTLEILSDCIVKTIES